MAWPTITATLAIAAVLMPLMAAQSKNTYVKCHNTPPGIRVMFKGVDITTLDLLPMDDMQEQGFKSPVVKMTCDIGKSFTSSITGNRFNEPDQSWHILQTPAGSMTATVNTHKSSNDVRKSMNINAGVSGFIHGISFSASAGYKKSKDQFSSSSDQINEVSAFEASLNIQIAPWYALELNEHAQTWVDKNLKWTALSWNKKKFMKFIEMFGTHYFQEGTFGGLLKSSIIVSQDYVKTKSAHDFEVEISANFWGIIKVKGGYSESEEKVESKFVKEDKTETKYFGGDANLLTDKGIEEWQPSVDANPWLVSGKLEPIYKLFKDPSLRAEMEKATDEYVMRIYLKEFYKDIVRARLKERSEYLDIYKDEVEKLLLQNVIQKDQVNNLRVPEWFSHQTQLCYQWKSSGDKAQCGDGTSKAICAGPNSWTPWYRDNTDDRNGGCKMQWSINSIKPDPWFKNVRLCFQWKPTVDWGQCGTSGLSRTLCAKVNEFTDEYLDNTNKAVGGCKLAWKLELPWNAPFWMTKSKMCFKWRPDGDVAQCMHGPGEKCAEAGQWTDFYLDDTDGRSGGCKMSWGIKVGL